MPYEGTIQLTKKYSKKEEEERITAVKSPRQHEKRPYLLNLFISSSAEA